RLVVFQLQTVFRQRLRQVAPLTRMLPSSFTYLHPEWGTHSDATLPWLRVFEEIPKIVRLFLFAANATESQQPDLEWDKSRAAPANISLSPSSLVLERETARPIPPEHCLIPQTELLAKRFPPAQAEVRPDRRYRHVVLRLRQPDRRARVADLRSKFSLHSGPATTVSLCARYREANQLEPKGRAARSRSDRANPFQRGFSLSAVSDNLRPLRRTDQTGLHSEFG